MKRIGILFGMENTFPPALVEKINSMKDSAAGPRARVALTAVTAQAAGAPAASRSGPTVTTAPAALGPAAAAGGV